MVDKNEDKISKILTAIENMEIDEVGTPTNFAKKIGVHPDTLRKKMDEYDNAKEIGWISIRKNDKDRTLVKWIRTDDSLNIIREIRGMKKEILDLKDSIDKLNIKLRKKKNAN